MRTRFPGVSMPTHPELKINQSQEMLLRWHQQRYDAESQIMTAFQFYEMYDSNGLMKSKHVLELKYRLTGKEEFEELVESEGFKITALYGDYSYSEFQQETSPFMIWVLQKREGSQ